MDRKEFLAQLGLGSTAIFTAACMQSCSKENNGGGSTTPPANVDFQIDLNSSANSALKNPGGYIIVQNIIVARTLTNSFLAVAAICPHQGATVQYESGPNQFYCSAHGSYFSSTGARISGPAQTGLKQYNTSLSGNTLRVFS